MSGAKSDSADGPSGYSKTVAVRVYTEVASERPAEPALHLPAVSVTRNCVLLEHTGMQNIHAYPDEKGRDRERGTESNNFANLQTPAQASKQARPMMY